MDRARFVTYWGLVIIGMGALLAFVRGVPIIGAVLVALWVAVAAIARGVGPKP